MVGRSEAPQGLRGKPLAVSDRASGALAPPLRLAGVQAERWGLLRPSEVYVRGWLNGQGGDRRTGALGKGVSCPYRWSGGWSQ